MGSCLVSLFHKRQFAAKIIVTCVRWYLRFSLSLRDVEELMAERGLSVDHTTIWRWTQTYAPEVQRRLRGQVKRKGSTWHMDETFVRISGVGCTCSVPSIVLGRQWTSTYPLLATGKPPNASSSEPWRIPIIDLRTFSPETGCEVIQPPSENCRTKAKSFVVAATEPARTQIIASNPITGVSNDACGPCKVHGRRLAR
jgi:hypothetical protein